MGRKSKLQRFAEIKEFPNVVELFRYKEGDYAELRGRWAQDMFGNRNPLILELACGKGEYVLSLAERYPDFNIVGIDKKGDRIWKGARMALDRQLDNAAFLRTHIDHLTNYFAPGEVSQIWITFPDPYHSTTKERKRLTSPKFQRIYRRILAVEGRVHLKTDDRKLFDYTLETLREHRHPVHEVVDDVHSSGRGPELLREVRTYYENVHLQEGKTIRYIGFGLH